MIHLNLVEPFLPSKPSSFSDTCKMGQGEMSKWVSHCGKILDKQAMGLVLSCHVLGCSWSKVSPGGAG